MVSWQGKEGRKSAAQWGATVTVDISQLIQTRAQRCKQTLISQPTKHQPFSSETAYIKAMDDFALHNNASD